jgi:tryptophan-rich sensory protein
MIKLKSLAINIIISLAVGGLSAFLSMNAMSIYQDLTLPAFAPKSIVFPIVWAVLYILMGVSSYLIYESKCDAKKSALTIYAVQLIVNFAWPLIFFNARAYLAAFIWLVILWLLVLWMIISFYKIKPLAGVLQIPYLIWITFAGFLNLMIYLLNQGG